MMTFPEGNRQTEYQYNDWIRFFLTQLIGLVSKNK